MGTLRKRASEVILGAWVYRDDPPIVMDRWVTSPGVYPVATIYDDNTWLVSAGLGAKTWRGRADTQAEAIAAADVCLAKHLLLGSTSLPTDRDFLRRAFSALAEIMYSEGSTFGGWDFLVELAEHLGPAELASMSLGKVRDWLRTEGMLGV